MLFKFMLSVAVMLVTLTTQAALDIVITEGVNQARPVAILPFKFYPKSVDEGASTATDQPSSHVVDQDLVRYFQEIVISDIKRSGKFNPIEQADFPNQQLTIDAQNIDDWAATNIEAAVVGSIKALGNNKYVVKYELIDIVRFSMTRGQAKMLANNKLMLSYDHILDSREMVINKQQVRQYAHRLSDLIFEKLTGMRGAFLTRIAYISVHHKQAYPYRLMVADYDGYNEQLLLRSKEPLMSPAWSPDGRRIAYVTFENRRSEVYIQDLYTQQREKIAGFEGINGAPVFSPNGQSLALSLSKDGNSEIYTIDIQSKRLRRITHHYAIDTEPNWAADGQSIIFTSERGGQPQIYQIHLGSKKLKRLTYEGTSNLGASMTPDNRYLLYVTHINNKYHIAKMDLLTHYVQVLTTTRLDESPSVSPNSGMVIYGTTHLGKQVLAAVSMDGRYKARLPALEGEVKAPSWSPFLK
ncbi:MAG: Tol-Pal system protein TolB [Shewanellaceae bacterium]|nr:Tol-Pal system protein TolB [Shewanellaceae bacterium]